MLKKGEWFLLDHLGCLVKKLYIATYNVLIAFIGVLWIAYGLTAFTQKHLVDFTAFYGAAKNLLVGLSPYRFYETFYGTSTFQSPFWVGWFFIPFTRLPINLAFIVFGAFNLVLSLVCLTLMLRWQPSKVSPLVYIFLLGCTLVLSFRTIQFGQVTLIQLFAATFMITALIKNRPVLAGLAIPLVIIKPHLILFFLFAAFRRGGRKMLLAGVGSTLVFMLISFLIQHSWISDMLQVVIYGQKTTIMMWKKYVTLGGLFSLPPWISMVGCVVFLLILILVDGKFRSVPNKIWLPITLVLSLATAPYAFAYDLPLLLPALIWSCLPLKPLPITVISTVTFIALISGFLSNAYIAVIIIAIYSIRVAILHMRLQGGSI